MNEINLRNEALSGENDEDGLMLIEVLAHFIKNVDEGFFAVA